MKISFYKLKDRWEVDDRETTLCKDFIYHTGSVISNRTDFDCLYRSHFELNYIHSHKTIVLECNGVGIVGIKSCPWCGEKIEFEVDE